LAEGWLGTVFQVDFEVLGTMFGKGVCPFLAEYVGVLVVFPKDTRHIRLGRIGRGRSSTEGRV